MLIFTTLGLTNCRKNWDDLRDMRAFSGVYFLTDVETRGIKMPIISTEKYLMDTIAISGSLNDGLFILTILDNKNHSGSSKYEAERKDYKAILNKPNENNRITVNFKQIKKSIYIEDLTGDDKFYLMTSGLVDEIGGKADTVRYYYTAIQ